MYTDLEWRFDTVYLGGGTPSNLSADRLGRVLEGIGTHLHLEPRAICLEANPDDVTAGNLRLWRSLGVSFLSVGVQSFDDERLRFLGRAHSAGRSAEALRLALQGGFETVNADLIFGLPGQGGGRWRSELGTAVALGVQHISCYQLTVHDGTVFGRRRRVGRLTEAPEDDQAELYRLTHEILNDAGFQAYEVSNFARPGHRSLHNLGYWDGAAYLGLGPAAHSFDGDRRRWWNRRKVRLWQREIERGRRPQEAQEVLTREERALEAVMLGLRLADGLDLAEVEQIFGVDLVDSNREALAWLAECGLVAVSGSRVRPTARGMAVADGLARSIDVRRRANSGSTPADRHAYTRAHHG